ncbi:MAG: cyclodeaminase/cyclohydrolase family protein [Acidobacteriota bacterium]|nr:cyclodeaminase/cyclohydrolase family protein [Acidobacteriota bacterium]
MTTGKDKEIRQGFVNEAAENEVAENEAAENEAAAEKKAYVALPVDEFTYQLSSKEPVPGGGGAAALAGALGAALGGMVANLTIGKPKYADVEDEVQALNVAVYRVQKELLGLIEKDAEVFAPLADAYRMASGSEEEKAEKERVMQACLKQASLVPLEIMEKCAEILPMIGNLAEKGSVLAVSDAGCAAALLKAAMLSAWLNVRINIRLIKDETFVLKTDRRGQELLSECLPLADKIYSDVENSFG